MSYNNHNEHLRHVLLFLYHKGKKATQAHREICEVYGDNSMNERTCHFWFKRFRSGNTSVKNNERSGRPVEVSDDKLKSVIESDPNLSVRDMIYMLNLSRKTIILRAKRIGYVRRDNSWHKISTPKKTDQTKTENQEQNNEIGQS